jgi:hypothetical protein
MYLLKHTQWLPVGMTKNGLEDWQSKLIKLGSVFSALLGFKRVAIWRCTGVQVQQHVLLSNTTPLYHVHYHVHKVLGHYASVLAATACQ